MSVFVKRKINGPQMRYIVALAEDFSFRADVWTEQEYSLKLLIDSSKWLRPKLETCAKSLAPMTVLVRCTNNVMVSADRSDVIDGDSRGQNAVVGYDRHTAVYVSQKVVHQTHGDNFVNS